MLSLLLSLSGTLIFLESSKKALSTEYSRLEGIEPPIVPPTSAQLVVIGAIIGLSSNIIFTDASFKRLRQREQSIREGTTNVSITPNVNISTGAALAVASSVFLTVGAIQNERQSRITIV